MHCPGDQVEASVSSPGRIPGFGSVTAIGDASETCHTARMYDAELIADGLPYSAALALWRKEAARLVKTGETAKGVCVGYRHQGYGAYAVYRGKQDGEAVKEPPRMKKPRSRTRR